MTLTKHLIKFRRNNSLLLLNGGRIKPILIDKGKEHILSLLEDVNNIRDKRLLELLLYHNIIVEDNDKEDYRIKTNNPEGSKTSGLSLYLLLSQGCNLGCVYCLNGEKTYKKSENLMMKEEVAYRGIDKLSKAIIEGGNLEVVFFGGEPLLNWPLAKKVIIYCEDKVKKGHPKLQIKYHLTSNLTLLPKDLIEWAKRYNITFLCDIDGPKGLHNLTRPYRNKKGSYDNIVKNIEKIRRAGLEVALRATLTSHNMDYIEEISRHHKEIGGAGSAFVSVNAVTSDENILPKSLLPDPDVVAKGLRDLVRSNIWDKKNIFPLNGYLERIRPDERNIWCCGAPHGNTPVLDVNGDIYACIYLVGIKRYKLGNVFSDDEYPDKKVVKMMLEVINIDNSDSCKRCKLRYICGGGCPVGRFTIKENPNASDEIIKYTHDVACKVNKAMIEEALWHYAEKVRDEKENIGNCSFVKCK
ncbi:MAG: radical SAM protein [bacterium]